MSNLNGMIGVMEDPVSLTPLPKSWSELTWEQLCDCWRVKMRYGGNADVARVAAMLTLLHLTPCIVAAGQQCFHDTTGEFLFHLKGQDGRLWSVTPRAAAQIAKSALPWFDYPYGDLGEPVVKDEKGKVVKEARDPVRGYVSNMRDALILPETTYSVKSRWFRFLGRVFSLPQVACNNLTWQQYRSLQAISPALFSDDIAEEEVLDLQAQFLAHCLVPRSLSILDTTGGSIRIRPHYEFMYNTAQAEGMVSFWRRHADATLFHICFQCYQTALTYYASAYPLLFSESDKGDKMRDALQGEVGTINTIMKYAGYAEQQQVYDSNLPFVLDILNTMTKEAKEIEKMNAKIKK